MRESLLEAARAAVAACPVGALSLREESPTVAADWVHRRQCAEKE
jgi:hypothetical protein